VYRLISTPYSSLVRKSYSALLYCIITIASLCTLGTAAAQTPTFELSATLQRGSQVANANVIVVNLYARNLPTSVSGFAFGPSNFAFTLNGVPVNYAASSIVTPGPWDADTTPGSYLTMLRGGTSFATLTIRKRIPSITPSVSPAFLLPGSARTLIASIAIPVVGVCTGTATFSWITSSGAITDYGLNNIKPGAIYTNPLGGISLSPSLTSGQDTVCTGSTPIVYKRAAFGDYSLITSIGSSLSGTLVNVDSITYTPGTTSGIASDTLVQQIGTCIYRLPILVDGRKPVITFPSAKFNQICGAQNYTLQSDQPGLWLFKSNSGGVSLTPANNASGFTVSFGEPVAQVFDTVIVLPPSGCLKGDTIVFEVNPKPVILGPPSGLFTVCVNTPNFTLTGNISMERWERFRNGSKGVITFSNAFTYTPDSAGIDTIVATYKSCTDTAFVTVLPAPAAQIIADTSQFSTPYINVYKTGIQAGYTYNWAVQTVTGAGVGSITYTSPTKDETRITYSTVGTYRVILQVTAPIALGGCVSNDTFDVNAKPFTCAQADFVNNDTVICLNEKVPVYLTTYIADSIRWQTFDAGIWKNVTGFGSTSQVYLTPTLTSIGTYQYRAVAYRNVCVADTSPVITVDVTSPPTPTLLATPTNVEICEATSAIVSVLTGYTASALQWQQSVDGFLWVNATPNSGTETTDAYQTPLLTSSLFYRLRFSTLCDSSFSNAAFVSVTPFPTGSFSYALSDSICPGSLSLPLNAVAAVGTGSWSQVNGSGGFLNSNDPNTRYVSVDADAGKNITLRWTVKNGTCTDSVYTSLLKVNDFPLGTFTTNLLPICQGDTTPNLGATVTKGVGRWASTGSGFFLPNNLNPNAYYQSVLADGDTYVDLQWIVQLDTCNADTFVRTLYVGKPPSGTFATSPGEVCINTATAPLGATITFGQGYWLTSGTGTFADPNSFNTVYTANEVGGGPVNLSWVVTSGGCSPEVYTQELIVSDTAIGGFNTVIPAVCAGSPTIPLGAQLVRGIGQWTSNGAGTFLPSATDTSAIYVSDTTDAGSTINLIWTVTNGSCPIKIFTRPVTVLSTLVAGTFNNILGDICQNTNTPNLGATVQYGTGQWETDGSGTFVPNDLAPNAFYQPGPSDIDQTVNLTWVISNGTCNKLRRNQPVFIWGTPTASWTRIFSPLCIGDSTGLLGASSIIGQGRYFTPNGQGYFSPSDSVFLARYVSVAADSNKNIFIGYRTLNGPVCDTLLTFPTNGAQIQVQRVNGFPQGSFNTNLGSICAGSPSSFLAATLVNGVGTWSVSSNCSGSFLNPNTPSITQYVSDPNDAGQVCTIAYTISTGGCADSVYQRPVTILNSLVQGSFNTVIPNVCFKNDTSIQLGAVVTTGTGSWSSTGTGQFIDPVTLAPTTTNPNARYVPSLADRGDTIKLTWTISNGTCNPLPFPRDVVISDSANGFIIPPAQRVYCLTQNSDTIKGNSSTGLGFWSIPFGSISSAVNPNIVYTPDPTLGGDNRVVLRWITLTTPCKSDTDTVSFYFYKPPFGSFANPPATICAGAFTAPLDATVLSGVGKWTTSGSGTFFADSLPNTQYQASAGDAGQTVTLTWTINNGVGYCAPVSYSQPLTVLNSAIVAGFSYPIDTVCEGKPIGPLGATLSQGIAEWSVRNGTGFFIPDKFDPNATYIPSATDFNKDVYLIWNVTQAGCDTSRFTDSVRIRSTPAGSFNTRLTSVCVDQISDTLSGTVSGTGYGFWDCVGCAGTFTYPDSTTNTLANYVPDPSDGDKSIVIRWNVTKNFCDTVRYARTLFVANKPAGDFSTVLPTICALDLTIPLGATATIGVGRYDCINCQGGFAGGNDNPNARYISVFADSGQTVTITWAISNGVCDTLVFTNSFFVDYPSLGGFPTPPASTCSGTPTTPLTAFTVHGIGTWLPTTAGSFSSLTQPNAIFTPNIVEKDTTIQLTWQVDNGVCSAVNYNRFFTIIAPPRGSITGLIIDSICARDSSDVIVAVDSNGTGLWATPNGLGRFSGNVNGPSTRYLASPADANKWIYLERRLSVPGCATLTLRDSVYVTPIFPYTLSPDDSSCAGIPLTLSVSGGTSYSWRSDPFTPGSYIIASSANFDTIRVLPPSGLTTKFIVTIQNQLASCEVLDTINVTVKPILPLTISIPGGTNICKYDVLTLQANGQFIPGTIQWSPDSLFLNPNQPTVTVIPPNNQVQKFVLRATMLNGCESSDSTTVQLQPSLQPIINAGYSFCENSISYIIFDENGPDYRGCTSIEWYDTDEQTVIAEVFNGAPYGVGHPNYINDAYNYTFNATQKDDRILIPTDSTRAKQSFVYSYRCVSANPCVGVNTTNVVINPTPRVTFDVVQDSINNTIVTNDTVRQYYNRKVTFRVNKGPNAPVDSLIRYSWYFGDPVSPFNNVTTNSPTITHDFSTSGKYTVALFVTDILTTCNDFQVKSNYITILPENFFFPSAFSPNGDSLNDTFRPLPKENSPRVMKVQIFNRNGQVIYQSSGDTTVTPPRYAAPWTGNNSAGEPADPGPYTYRFVILLNRSEGGTQLLNVPTEFTGLVTLVR
jgi:hypothetical protein